MVKLTLTSLAIGVLAASLHSAQGWSMKPVQSIQARVQGDKPTFDKTKNIYVSSFGKTLESQHRAVLDSVNLASVEGALKFVQSECINTKVLQNCERKNNVKYVVFYNITIVNPNNMIAEFGSRTDLYPEYGPFVAMDIGACTPTGNVIPPECQQYNGVDGQPNLGSYVGGVPRADDARAPYNNTIWFSYPNSCIMKKWPDKTDECRASNTGGLCPIGTQPDGIKCTYSYEIMGYLALDDLVGITAMVNTNTNKPFTNYTEFCNAKKIEFSATEAGGSFTDVQSDLTFWNDPTSTAANANRTQAMVKMYNDLVSTAPSSTPMKKMVDSTQLAAMNPPCYENSKICADAAFGCRRKLYAQVCEVCTAAAPDCVVKKAGFVFPTLQKAPRQTKEGSRKAAGKSYGMTAHSVTSTIVMMACAMLASYLM